MNKNTFMKECFLWVAIITAIIFLIIGLCNGVAVGYTLLEEIGLYALIWLFVTAVLEFIMWPVSHFLYNLFIKKKDK